MGGCHCERKRCQVEIVQTMMRSSTRDVELSQSMHVCLSKKSIESIQLFKYFENLSKINLLEK